MTSAHKIVMAVIKGIKQDLEHYNVLERLLIEQRSAMYRHKVNDLDSINRHLTSLQKQVLENAKVRARLLSLLGLSLDTRGIQKLSAKLDKATGEMLECAWQQLFNLTLNCQRINENNGKLLAVQQELVNKLVSPEQGNDYQPEQNQLYG